MKHRILAVGAASLMTVGMVSGCTLPPSSGSVVVEVREMGPDVLGDSYEVHVTEPGGTDIRSDVAYLGGALTFEDVPFGWVVVEASPACTVETSVSAESPVLRLIIEGTHCTMTD
ncbi:hypothetical protein [Humidisolicoccus flavus]|uniref:hypothetical protein n=1 Tax=Humidisolicoccus flavus TaxID=3111414 RepID=UPI00325380C3